jgi:hypothetical protein
MEKIKYAPTSLSTSHIPFDTFFKAKRIYKRRVQQLCRTSFYSFLVAIALGSIYFGGRFILQNISTLASFSVTTSLLTISLFYVVVWIVLCRKYCRKYFSFNKSSFNYSLIAVTIAVIIVATHIYLKNSLGIYTAQFPVPSSVEPRAAPDAMEAPDSPRDPSFNDLSGYDLSGYDLSGYDLSGYDLSGADLSGADLSGAKLISANLSGADLSGADLSDANLSDVNLSDASVSSTLFGSGIGLFDEQKQNLTERGAIFDNGL